MIQHICNIKIFFWYKRDKHKFKYLHFTTKFPFLILNNTQLGSYWHQLTNPKQTHITYDCIARTWHQTVVLCVSIHALPAEKLAQITYKLRVWSQPLGLRCAQDELSLYQEPLTSIWSHKSHAAIAGSRNQQVMQCSSSQTCFNLKFFQSKLHSCTNEKNTRCLFYLTNTVCHFMPLLNCKSGLLAQWSIIILWMSHHEVATDSCQIK